MKILDVDLFQEGLLRNITMLDRLSSEIEAIHRSVEGLVQMEDQLKGAGGNAIRSFYEECHLPFLHFFQLFSEHFKQVLHQMEAALHSLEPDSSGYILEQFLEGELEQGLTFIGQLTASLTDETNSIMDQVSDIVGLPHLDDSGVQEGVIQSKRNRDDTVMQLHEFDASQTTALNPIEQDLQTMDTWLTDMEGLFKDGLTDVHFEINQWAALASCNPLLTDLATSANSDIDSAEVENENDTIVDTGIEVVKGVGTGLYGAGKDFVVGLWDTITNPKATVEGLVNAVTNPVETYNTIKTAISESYERDMVNGDANSRGHWVAYAIGTVATSIVGTKGANALVKTGTTAAKAAVPKVVSATNNASSSIVNLLPYTPRPLMATSVEIPYNVVNSVGLKDQLLTMAKVESGVTGTDNGVRGNINSSWKDLMSDADKITYNDYWNNIAKSMEKTPENSKLIGSERTWNEFLEYNPSSDVETSVESYIKLITDQSPWPENYTPKSTSLPIGTRINMAMSPGQDDLSPGGWATIDEVSDVNYVRNNLAVQYDFKPEIDRVNIYEVVKELPVKEGSVGPQIDLRLDKYLPGGGSQEALNVPPPLRMKYLKYIDSVPLNK